MQPLRRWRAGVHQGHALAWPPAGEKNLRKSARPCFSGCDTQPSLQCEQARQLSPTRRESSHRWRCQQADPLKTSMQASWKAGTVLPGPFRPNAVYSPIVNTERSTSSTKKVWAMEPSPPDNQTIAHVTNQKNSTANKRHQALEVDINA